ncbi:kinase-like domain-containing protein, partial [Rhizoctonia solani]
HIFKAVQCDTQRLVALKQSRASLQLNWSTLHHEARVLKLLSGHPSIPEVYAYGRIEHFELISMQLLHQNFTDVVKEDGPLSLKIVVDVACQMMDALQHVHSHGLVHRDIKPDNMMLQCPGSWKLCLIDFGLTRPVPSSSGSAQPTSHEDSDSSSNDPAHVFGTLPFASLNAHEGAQLTFRDDFESLAYTLLWLIRGSLPWSHYTESGTQIGQIRQVFAQKKRHTGSILATELPVEFGEFVDYARSLLLDEKPGYEEWRGRLKQIEFTTCDDILIPECQDSPSKYSGSTNTKR